MFFPPALVKTTRGGIEYGIGSIPLGGYVKIPGMHRPAAGDVDAQFGRALDESPWLARQSVEACDTRSSARTSRQREPRFPSCGPALERAQLSEAAQRNAEKGLTDLEDALSADAYWRPPA